MAYIDAAYFSEHFPGVAMDEAEFARLAQVASDLIDLMVYSPVPLADGLAPDAVRLACGYEVECLYEQGGMDAVNTPGLISTERVGGYAITMQGGSSRVMRSVGGIPLSTLCYGWLVKSGLMCRSIPQRRC